MHPSSRPPKSSGTWGPTYTSKAHPRPPRNLPEVQATIWKQLCPQRLSPDAAMMVPMA